MKSALLFYRKLVAELLNMGFEINPYDPCVANKMVNGTQMTVRWHVDDLMISHTSQDNIMAFVKKIKNIWWESCRESWDSTQLFRNDIQLLFWQWSKDQHESIYIKGNTGVSARDFGNVHNTACRSFIQNLREWEEAEWRTGGGIPSHNIPTLICCQ